MGDDTEFGKIARELRAANTGMTPLQEKLAKLGKVIAVVGSIVAALVFVLQVARFVASGTASFDTTFRGVHHLHNADRGRRARRPADHRGRVPRGEHHQNVQAERAGQEDGGVRDHRLHQRDLLGQNRHIDPEPHDRDRGVQCTGPRLEKPEQIRNRMLLENFCVNGTADVTFPGATEAEAGAMPEFIGNPTECALLVAAHKAGLDYRIRRKRATVLHTYPFSSETKSMTTVVRDGDGITMFAKGSPEKMLDLCAVDAKTRGEIEREIAKFQAQSCRAARLRPPPYFR